MSNGKKRKATIDVGNIKKSLQGHNCYEKADLVALG